MNLEIVHNKVHSTIEWSCRKEKLDLHKYGKSMLKDKNLPNE